MYFRGVAKIDNSLRRRGCNPSGPGDLSAFSLPSFNIISVVVISIIVSFSSTIGGPRDGKLSVGSILRTEVKNSKNDSAFSLSELITLFFYRL